ncbi:hypothetical protein BI364_13730 [Acidihalobacter yilgarnensis]|uniref:STAS domain-containing protein n=1 Tax=Acidihalobacter yilgarnensis TaxID=2819280 RepID=A0A1D8IR54_9GAMM|nr:STAS domain-containing protein [Acidihalobacter yilgarnensis]AOU98877.1 hypothetical protein BI364_13730 [Acidihalobacter yilgarnensis]
MVPVLSGMHLTRIGQGNILLEPGEGLDPADPDAYLEPLLAHIQKRAAKRLIYDLKNVPFIDAIYYQWLVAVHDLCNIANIEMVAVHMRPAAAYALSRILEVPPPFRCALEVERR